MIVPLRGYVRPLMRYRITLVDNDVIILHFHFISSANENMTINVIINGRLGSLLMIIIYDIIFIVRIVITNATLYH